MSERDAMRAAARRLVPAPRAGCWLAAIVRAIAPREVALDDRIERTPAHYLVAAWSPQASGLYERLPDFAAIASPDSQRALRELFVHLPPEVPVHLAGAAHVDLALVADMVLLCDTHLEPYQRDALQAFAREQRDALRRAIVERYTDREEGFVRFRDRALGGGSPDRPDDA